jgi:hypothetical protein
MTVDREIRTPQGERRVQDSNAYEVHMPGENVGAARIPGKLGDQSGLGRIILLLIPV